jgi:hypothetical protein
MSLKILVVTNAMIGESSLPNFLASKFKAEGVRVSALDQLNCSFQRDFGSWSEQQMHVLGHQDKSVQLEFSLSAVAVYCFQEKSNVGFDDEVSCALPSRERREIRSWR